jgi:hypothetical protein
MLKGSEKITLFLGNYGSGKTEVAVNYALFAARKREANAITLVDLDLVNPYFRSREARQLMEAAGIRVVAPDEAHHHADLPILVPEVRSALLASTGEVILDVGGDDVGARVLGTLHDGFVPGSYRALMVLNGNRPFTGDVDGIRRIRADIEMAGRITVTGLVSNTHLMEETTAQTIVRGVELARRAAHELEIPLHFVTAPEELVQEVSGTIVEPVLPLARYLATSWQQVTRPQDNLGKELFRL